MPNPQLPADDDVYLYDGVLWPPHEGYLIGNDRALRNLIRACERALEQGECHDVNLCVYDGVKMRPPMWFEDGGDEPEPARRITRLCCLLMFGVAGSLVCLGIYQLLAWTVL